MAQIYGVRSNLTTADVFIPEKWSKDVTLAREDALQLGKWCERRNVDSADTLHIPNVANPAAPGAISADGDVDDTTIGTDTDIDLLLDKKFGYILNIPTAVSLQSQYDYAEIQKKKYGFGLGAKVEDDLIDLDATLSFQLGDLTSDISPTRFLSGVVRMDKSNVPRPERYSLWTPEQMGAMLDTDRFVLASSVGWSRENSPIITGEFGQAYGVLLGSSNRLNANGDGFTNLMFHKEAMVLGILQDIKTEELAKTIFSRRIGLSTFYGVIVKRADHGIRMLSR